MSILAWDVETTGIPDFKARSNDPKQPHIVQLAIVEYDDDGSEVAGRSYLVRPDGWVIPPEMTAIHGVTQERAMDEGMPEAQVISIWMVAQGRAKLRVAHNSPFDVRMARISMVRAGFERDFIEAIELRPDFCTCAVSKPIVRCPPTEKMVAAGFTGFKSPNLQECMTFFFDEPIVGGHDALVDARCAGRIYWYLKTIGKAA